MNADVAIPSSVALTFDDLPITEPSNVNDSDILLSVSSQSRDDWLELSKELRVPFYVVIFIVGVIGNASVIITLLRNRHFLTVTNLFLLNLSISDLLLGLFCMPFTLVGAVLKDFIFGEVMCKLIPYFQGEC